MLHPKLFCVSFLKYFPVRRAMAAFCLAGLLPVASSFAQTISFSAPTAFPSGLSPLGVAVGDVNLDGKPDLAVANNGDALVPSGDVSVLLGNGSGSFGAATHFAAGSNPIAVALGDFNGDGKPDLAVANSGPLVGLGGNVSILLGNGAGSFSAPTNFAAGSRPFSIAAGDFNRDGKLDLAVANADSNNVSILLGAGTGTFGAPTNFAVGTRPLSLAAGDFNGDGKLDVAVANEVSDNVSVLLGTGLGTFGAATNFAAGDGAGAVAAADLNGDGKLDLAVANANSANVSVLLGTGTGSFGAATNFATGGAPRSVAAGDLNGDGLPHLAVVATLNTVAILPGTGGGAFSAPTLFTAASFAARLAIGDLDRDGRPDLAVTGSLGGSVSVLLNTTAFSPSGSFAAAVHFAVHDGPLAVAAGDLNGDGKLDLAVANGNSEDVSILLGTGAGSFGAAANFAVSATPGLFTPNSVALADFNRDGKLDLAVANQNADNVAILLGTGGGSFGAPTHFLVGDFPGSVAAADLDGDGKLDLVVANASSNNVSVLLGNGTGAFGAATNFAVGSFPLSVAVADLNHDGKPDIAVANRDSDNVSVLLGTGGGAFAAATNFAAQDGPATVVVGDFNRDGHPDLAAGNFLASDSVSILLGTGTGSFGSATSFPVGNVLSLASGDFNRDGILDLAAADWTDNVAAVLLGAGTGAFGAAMNFAVQSGATSVAAGDFNGDGKPDLAVTNWFSDTVSILLNGSPGPGPGPGPGPSTIGDLISLVESFGLHHGIENSLLAKLQNAQKSLDKGNLGAACNQLDAFIHEVQAQSGKKITVAQANQLIAAANQIKTALGCP